MSNYNLIDAAQNGPSKKTQSFSEQSSLIRNGFKDSLNVRDFVKNMQNATNTDRASVVDSLDRQFKKFGTSISDISSAVERAKKVYDEEIHLKEQSNKQSFLENTSREKLISIFKDQINATSKLQSQMSRDSRLTDVWNKNKDFYSQISRANAETRNLKDTTSLFNETSYTALLKAQKEQKDALREYQAAAADDWWNQKITKGMAPEAAKWISDIMGENIAKKISKKLAETLSALVNKVNKIIETTEQYRTDITTRLQGLNGKEYDFGDLLDSIATNVGLNPYVDEMKLLGNIADAAKKGIGFNVEERAYLQTLSDSVAQSFEAFDASLTRLIRLQQSDTTAGRLGMEASLTSLFNNMFSDSSYMASGTKSSVSSSLLDSSALMSATGAAEFEYQVNKWLGALYEAGMDSSTVNNLANALNLMSTGNTASLSSNSLNPLFAMAAANSGQDYATLLKEGLDASSVNSLLKSVVEYLQHISENSDNNVVTSAWANAFGLDITDITAVKNLSKSDISALSGNSNSYGNMISALSNAVGINTQGNRLGLSKMVDNLISNMFAGTSFDLMDDPLLYGLYKATNTLKGVTGGIALPNVGNLGNFLDLTAFNVEDLISGGIIGISAIKNLGGALANLNKWPSAYMGDATSGNIKTLTRGNVSNTVNGIARTSSASAYVGNSSTEDMESSAIAGQVDKSSEMAELTSAYTDNGESLSIDSMDELIEITKHIDSGLFGSPATPVLVEVSSSSSIVSMIETLTSSNYVMNVRVDSFSDSAQFKDMDLMYLNFKNFISESFKKEMSELIVETLENSNIAKNIATTKDKLSGTLPVSVSNTMMTPIYTRESMF